MKSLKNIVSKEQSTTVDKPVLKEEQKSTTPNHYDWSVGTPTIEIIEEVSKNYDGFTGFLIGNVLKYLFRGHRKNGLDDLYKARTYLNWLIEKIESAKKSENVEEIKR